MDAILPQFDHGAVLTSSAILTGLLGVGFLIGFRIDDTESYFKLRPKIKLLFSLGFLSAACPLVVVVSVVAGFYSNHLHLVLFLAMLILMGCFLYLMWNIHYYEHKRRRWHTVIHKWIG